tara:strand:+ start:1528 stop:2193 length:666 start_codon:yes stop_codon:yes gene_type:complete
MENITETKDSKKTFMSHVFSNTEEDKGELLNVSQYAVMGIIPIVALNKTVQRFIPEADPDKSSIELLAEILIQIVVIFVGLVFIHRIITFVPTYSGFKYENLVLTNVILAFLVIVLSIQSKVGTKVNIIFDRLNDLWNGYSEEEVENTKKNVRVRQPVQRHAPSQADNLDNTDMQNGVFPPAPSSAQQSNQIAEGMALGFGGNSGYDIEPMAANGALGSNF